MVCESETLPQIQSQYLEIQDLLAICFLELMLPARLTIY